MRKRECYYMLVISSFLMFSHQLLQKNTCACFMIIMFANSIRTGELITNSVLSICDILLPFIDNMQILSIPKRQVIILQSCWYLFKDQNYLASYAHAFQIKCKNENFRFWYSYRLLLNRSSLISKKLEQANDNYQKSLASRLFALII